MFNTKRISDAFALAAQVHADQKHKGTSIAYISHPMAIASQVAVWSGDENQFIAALLLDVVEDGGIHYQDVGFGEKENIDALVLPVPDRHL